VVGDGHDRTGRQVRPQRTGGVRDDQRSGSEKRRQPHQVDDLGRRVALVGVQPAAAVEHEPAGLHPDHFGRGGMTLDRFDVEGKQLAERPGFRDPLTEVEIQAGAGDQDGFGPRPSSFEPSSAARLEFGVKTRVRPCILALIHSSDPRPGVRETIHDLPVSPGGAGGHRCL